MTRRLPRFQKEKDGGKSRCTQIIRVARMIFQQQQSSKSSRAKYL
jgi:hypothetical protein